MNVSVIVPTYNGEKKIPILLEALRLQTFSDFEVIVVVDGSTDNTLNVLSDWQSRFKSFRFINQKNGGRSVVRNRGAKEAKGGLLIFYDDDMVPEPDSVEKHVQIHSTHAIPRLVVGNLVEPVEASKTDIQNYKASLTEFWLRKYDKPIANLTQDDLFFSAANCSMKKSLFEKLNGFDERLTDAEDFNLAQRAMKAGIPIMLDQGNKAVHRDMITAASYIQRQRQYRLAHERLAALYPEFSRTQGATNNIAKRFAYRLFAHVVWVKWIDTERLTFIPKKIRYKLYDVIIHALSVEYPEVRL